MGTEKVKEYLANFGLADRVMEFKESSATVAEAAADLGCEPARIGKTMAFDVAGQPMLVVIAGLPAALIGIFFTSNFLIEIIFNLDGLGLLGFEAVQQRDYPVIFGTLFMFTLVGMLLQLISDVMYQWIDPRIDFAQRGSV